MAIVDDQPDLASVQTTLGSTLNSKLAGFRGYTGDSHAHQPLGPKLRKDDHEAPDRIREWAAPKVGGTVEYGFGYGTWVFIGEQTVIKIDPEVGRPDRFGHELALSDLEIPGVATPKFSKLGRWREDPGSSSTASKVRSHTTCGQDSPLTRRYD